MKPSRALSRAYKAEGHGSRSVRAAPAGHASAHQKPKIRPVASSLLGREAWGIGCPQIMIVIGRSMLRNCYGVIIQVVALTLVAGLFISGLTQNLPMANWVLTMTPAAAILAWAAREFYRQRDTAERCCERARAGECDVDVCRQRSREFQNSIYTRRVNGPLIMPFLYRFKRLRLEDEMNEGAADFLRELASAPAAASASANVQR